MKYINDFFRTLVSPNMNKQMMEYQKKNMGYLSFTSLTIIPAILIIVLSSFNLSGDSSGLAKKENIVHDGKIKRTFILHAPIRNLAEFEELAKQASRLKPYGKVEINISTLADKSFYEKPSGRNPWYEYASNNPTPYKFFPDTRITPFIPADFVKKNRQLLLAKAKILRAYGLGAAFWCYEPNFLPDAFFDAYPHMRGPRVDHPRRSNHAAFAPCISVKETQYMYADMVAELLRSVPEINTFFFKTNDAGSGICWSDWQYSGPNGPMHCKKLSMGVRVATLMNTFKKGAEMAGQNITIHLTGSMFSDKEKEEIYKHLPDHCYFQSHNSDKVKGISSSIVGNYPVKGFFNPLEVLNTLNSANILSGTTIFISFRASYDRGYERLEAIDQLMGMIEDYFADPPARGKIATLQELHKLCEKWAGKDSADRLFNSLVALDEAYKFKKAIIPRVSPMYWGVSTRQINRPLIIVPQRLSKKEEAYFLPYVFNVSEKEARQDYTDINGGHRTIPTGVMEQFLSGIKKVYLLLESIDQTAPEKEFIQNMATALRIYSSIMRSAGNFAEAQAIRDRNAEKLGKAPHRPNKMPAWTGDPDLLRFNEIMRDELDNAQELIDLLENGGMDMICHADDSLHEDTFLLGPDLIDQIKQKRKIMLRHWTDIESYMTTPFK